MTQADDPMLQSMRGTLYSVQQRISEMMTLQGRTLARQNAATLTPGQLQDAEFKVFSQFGDDGIIQHLVHHLIRDRQEQRFVEFGVGNYLESNTRFLLVNNNWQGLVMDSSCQDIDFIRSQEFYWRHNLTAQQAWITRDNINQLLSDAGFSGDIGLLSVDIDGNDYWVWQAIDCVRPVIVIVEWNSVFGPDAAITVPYQPQFDRTAAHYSNLYFGASIAALAALGTQKGYALVGSNSAGNNLYFVRQDRLNDIPALTPQQAYIESSYRESRDVQGNLTFLAGAARRAEIADMPVLDIHSGELITVAHATTC